MNKTHHATVLTEVVAADLCVGCGVCATVCPQKKLEVKWNTFGAYTIEEGITGRECPSECSLCLRVCPFSPYAKNEDEVSARLYNQVKGIKHSKETGFFGDVYVGYSADERQRMQGSAGGLATWFLGELLHRGEVDYVLCVAPGRAPDPLFAYGVCSSEEEVQSCAKSAYYPVNLKSVLDFVASSDKRFAVTCLPCFAKALRLAALIHPRLCKNIRFVIGLVCSRGATAFFAEYATALAAGDKSTCERIIFRVKDAEHPASNHGHTIFWKDDDGQEIQKTIFWLDGICSPWGRNWFMPNACLYCDDVFAETADVVFGDAWLPEYRKDYRGTNIVITRSRQATDIFREARTQGAIRVQDMTLDQIMIDSQQSNVENKRQELSYRLWLASQKGKRVPQKRVSAKAVRNLQERRERLTRLEQISLSGKLWKESQGVESFQKRMNRVSFIKAVWRRSANVLRRILRRIAQARALRVVL